MSSAGAAAAIAAAQAAARRQREEEAQAQYTAEDLAGGFEFKFLRSATGEFKKPERLRAYLDEEARAGWELVEKFDNARLRLKRPVAARSGDAALPFDAYRTSVGTSEGMLAVRIVAGVLAAIALMLLVIGLATGKFP